MSSTGAEWETGIQGFIEKYKLTCVGSWDKFYVYVLFKSKQFYNFKKRNTMTNLALVEYNKGILYAAVGVPGSTHDGRMLKSTNLPRDISGESNHDIKINLQGATEIPQCTISDSEHVILSRSILVKNCAALVW